MAKKHGQIHGASIFQGKGNPGQKAMEWFFEPTSYGKTLRKNRVICVQQIISLNTTTSTSSTTTKKSRVCNSRLNGIDSCSTSTDSKHFPTTTKTTETTETTKTSKNKETTESTKTTETKETQKTTTKTTSRKTSLTLGYVLNTSKKPKESIGIVSSCTIKSPGLLTWSTFNGEQFCGFTYPVHYNRSEADNLCKAKVIFLFLILYTPFSSGWQIFEWPFKCG